VKLSAIISIGKEIKSTYEYRDPDQLMSSSGVISLMFPMGTALKSIKGFILSYNGNVAVTVNSDLSPEMIRIVRYHEFAHYILHVRSGLQDSVHDCEIYDAVSQTECEANLLAAELMLEDEEVLDALKQCGGFFEAASVLNVPPELLEFKLRLLREKGHRLPQAPLQAQGNYLGRFSDHENKPDHRRRRVSTGSFREGA